MVTYTEVYNHLNTNWNTIVIAKPTFRDKNLQFSAKYSAFLFINVLPKANMQSVVLNDGMHKRITYFTIEAVYDTMANATLALREIKRLMKSKTISGGAWSVFGDVSFTETRRRIVARIPCKEWIFVMNEDW